MRETLLKLQNLCYAYVDSPFALKDVCLTVEQGERIAVLGSNGAGKSTFFLLCNGVLLPDSGAIDYRGQRVTTKKKDLLALREKVGIVFQDPNQQLIGSTVEAEISFGPMNLKLSREEVSHRIDDAIQAMDLGAYRQRPPHYLSGGEKKRVSIADVLAMRPEIILFDEPTASLDPVGVEMLEGVLAELEEQGKTLLISTHDIDFAWQWATRILVFSEGRLVADDLPEAIFSDESILHQAGLRRPYLYDVARVLKERGVLPQSAPWPKTVADLEKTMRSH